MSRITRCKLQLLGKVAPDQSIGRTLTQVSMGAVWSPNLCEENGMFGKATPFASFSFNCTPESVEHMVVGKEYYVDITLAE